MKYKRKQKSVGGLQTASTVASDIGSTAISIAPLTGPAAPIVAGIGGALSLAGMGLGLGANAQERKENAIQTKRQLLQSYYDTYNNKDITYEDYIPTLNANYKMGGCRYRNRLGGQVKYKRKSC